MTVLARPLWCLVSSTAASAFAFGRSGREPRTGGRFRRARSNCQTASPRVAARHRPRPLHGLRLVRRRLRTSPAQPAGHSMEEVFDAPRRGPVHRLQRVRRGVSVPRHQDAQARRIANESRGRRGDAAGHRVGVNDTRPKRSKWPAPESKAPRPQYVARPPERSKTAPVLKAHSCDASQPISEAASST